MFYLSISFVYTYNPPDMKVSEKHASLADVVTVSYILTFRLLIFYEKD